jgi:hypothetical protein
MHMEEMAMSLQRTGLITAGIAALAIGSIGVTATPVRAADYAVGGVYGPRGYDDCDRCDLGWRHRRVIEREAVIERPRVVERETVIERPTIVERRVFVERPVIERRVVVERPAFIERPAIVERRAVIVGRPAIPVGPAFDCDC